jgi:hypothetical protein
MIAERGILFSDTRGCSIPWCFAQEVAETSINEGKEAYEHLKAICNTATWQDASEHEWYWDAWEDVLQKVVLQDDQGRVYSLQQDGDVFLVPHHKHIKWVTDKEELSDKELEDQYDEMLDDCYGLTVKIAGHDYRVSRALKEVDPTAHRCGFADWLDTECRAKNLFEADDKYYAEDVSEPDDYWDDPESYEGHYEWFIPFDYGKMLAENPVEFESDIPAMENH